MGVVVVQLGQAGNQLGGSFFNVLASNGLTAHANANSDFFRQSQDTKSSSHSSRIVARAVLVDMEPKVIAVSLRKAVSSSGPAHGSVPWTYSPKNVIAEESGSGNNWARGYYQHGPSSRDAVLEAVRLEVEEMDKFSGFVTMQSMAGGTGAGLGSYVVEALKDEYPSACILSNCIWPYESGEVIVQSYNVLLTLSHLQASADAVVLLQNEALSSSCKRTLGIERPSFDDMNHVATQALAAVLSPAFFRPAAPSGAPPPSRTRAARIKTAATPPAAPAPTSAPNTTKVHVLPDLVSLLCSHPCFRMLTLRFAPQVAAKCVDFTSFSWESELKQVRHWLNRNALREVEIAPSSQRKGEQTQAGARSVDRCVANMLVLRGPGSQQPDLTPFADSSLYPIWSVDPLAAAYHPAHFRRHEISIGLLSNCQSTLVPAIRLLSSAYTMYSSKAYLHQYFEHGMDEPTFEAAFATVEDLVTSYLTL